MGKAEIEDAGVDLEEFGEDEAAAAAASLLHEAVGFLDQAVDVLQDAGSSGLALEGAKLQGKCEFALENWFEPDEDGDEDDEDEDEDLDEDDEDDHDGDADEAEDSN